MMICVNYNYNNLFLAAALPPLFTAFFTSPAAVGLALGPPAALFTTPSLCPALCASAHEIIAPAARVDHPRTGWLDRKIITTKDSCVRAAGITISHTPDHSAFRWHCWDICIIGRPAGRVGFYAAVIKGCRH